VRKKIIGIVDYGVGNQSSVKHAILRMNYRAIVTSDKNILDECDILLLPGVGAFPKAMEELNNRNLSKYIRQQAANNKPIIGICLGMQLLLDCSYEQKKTEGLGLIPGEVVPFKHNNFHIGWSSIKCDNLTRYLNKEAIQSFYFNHSYVCSCSDKYIECVSQSGEVFPVIIRKEKVIGIQFHPEKSQQNGETLLKSIIEKLYE
jgi:imidazole glycerol-phosphate synthase subunit HisH